MLCRERRTLERGSRPLERLLSVVDFEVFRPTLDAVMMFKILVLQALYGLSDEQAEYQVRDRLSFMRFLGLGLGDRVPDRTTIWLFREALATAGAMEGLFARFDADLKERGYFALGGQIVDASIVEAPKQRLIREEKRGRVKAKPGPTLDGSEARMVEGVLIPAFGYSVPAAPVPRYDPPSSMCSPTRRRAWRCSSAPSALGARR